MNKYDTVLDELEKKAAADKKYISYFSDHRARYKSDLQNLEKYFAKGEILEIGSLPCHLTYCLEYLGYSVIGLDLNPERACSFITENNLNIIKCDIETEEFPFENDRFGIVLLNEVFEHLRINPLFTLQEINRVLDPEGIFILTTPNLYSLENIISFFCGKGLVVNPYNEFKKLETVGHMGHIREYSTSEIKNFLIQTGFEIEAVKYKSYNKSKKGFLVDLVYNSLPFWRPFQIVVSKKSMSSKQ